MPTRLYDRCYIYTSCLQELHNHRSARRTARSPVTPMMMWHRSLPTGAKYSAIVFSILLPRHQYRLKESRCEELHVSKSTYEYNEYDGGNFVLRVFCKKQEGPSKEGCEVSMGIVEMIIARGPGYERAKKSWLTYDM